MDRLLVISFINTSWFKQITEFIEQQPEFKRLLPIVAYEEYPSGFGKNPHETPDATTTRNVFEIILHGLSYAGVGPDLDYGKLQYLLLTNHFRQFTNSKLDINMNLPEKTQPDKVPIYRDLIKKMVEHNLTINELSYEHMSIIESVEGMTESTITLLYLLFDDVTSSRCLPYGDKQFKRGMSMFYGLNNPTKEELVKITDTWENKKVGLMFVVQYAHFSEFVDNPALCRKN